MTKLVAISLLQTCMIAGLPRSPVEGVQFVTPEEADRLIEANQATLAEIEGDDAEDEGDGLDAMSVKNLRALAKAEGATVEGDANTDAVIAAIRAHREDVAKAREELRAELDGLAGEPLVERAKADEVTIAEGADDAAIREAIFAKHFPPAD